MAKAAIEEPNGPLVIYVGRQATGCTYQMGPISRRRIREAFPDARIAPSVFVGYETKQDFEKAHGPIWDQLAIILTGLTREQIDKLGGIRIYDPVAESKWELTAATGQG